MNARAEELRAELASVAGEPGPTVQQTADGKPTLWVSPAQALPVLRHLKGAIPLPYAMLFDLTVIDERLRRFRDGQPRSDFTLVYELTSLGRNADVRIKVPLEGSEPSAATLTGLWPSANWYEREAFDMFGVRFEGHPNLRRILMPQTWKGHPLRKDHPARATELPPFVLDDERRDLEEEALRFRPEHWGLPPSEPGDEVTFMNLGPQHPGTHGVLRVVLQLRGEHVLGAIPDIGYHHRGAEKMGERQSWHTYIPYTDRVDYLAGVLNNMPYVLAVERLAGIEVPSRVQMIRVMTCELFRVISHLVWYGTFAADVGAMSPVFYTFTDREYAFDIVAAVMGGRMHPNYFRIGGVAYDLPPGWDGMLQRFVDRMTKRIREYDRMVLANPIFKARTIGIGALSRDEAVEWGVTGPMLRACGLAVDLRKQRPYSGYDQLEFEVPIEDAGDCYARCLVRTEEIRQSLRIIQQCIDGMPEGPHRADHPLVTPPRKAATMHDIETLIHHFLSVSWGPVVPPGEASTTVEAAKGWNAYYLISDGGPISYRTRIRAPSFPHMQTLPLQMRGHSVADVAAVLGAVDFVLADVDR